MLKNIIKAIKGLLGTQKVQRPATVPVRVTMGAKKIHGPNSDKPEGTRESIVTEGPQIKEITYQEAVGLFGEEWAKERFAGVEEATRG